MTDAPMTGATPGATTPRANGPVSPDRARRNERLAAIAILAVAAAYLAFGLRTAANSLGCDFLAYYDAANHWLAGQPIYDLTVTATGTCGIYQYPPPFVLLMLPFSISGFAVGTWLWIGFLVACWAVGTAILPVRTLTRWIILLLGAIGWPLIFGVRIGQVGPILYLLFAIAWRNLERPTVLGASIAVGALMKLQPGLLAAWLLARRDWRALAAAIVVGLAIVAVAAIVGLGDWIGMATLVRIVADAVTSDANVAIGATLHRAGADPAVAGAIQAINTLVVLALVLIAGLRMGRVSSFFVAIVGSQLISPIVWTHYALLLMLPVAWLLERRQWWAIAFPIAQVWILVPFIPLWSYTIQFYAAFIALLIVGWRGGTAPASEAASAPSTRTAGGSAATPEPAA